MRRAARVDANHPRLISDHMMHFTIPVKTVSGMNVREHWAVRAKRVKTERSVSYLYANHAPRVAPLPVSIMLCRVSAGVLDDDNLRSALKGVRDGIADAYGVADNDPRIRWCYRQEKCKRGHYEVSVVIQRATNCDP